MQQLKGELAAHQAQLAAANACISLLEGTVQLQGNEIEQLQLLVAEGEHRVLQQELAGVLSTLQGSWVPTGAVR